MLSRMLKRKGPREYWLGEPSTVARLKALIAVIAWGDLFRRSRSRSPRCRSRRSSGSGLEAEVGARSFSRLQKRLSLLSWRECGGFSPPSVFGVFFHNAIQAMALRSVSAGMSGLIVAANPVAIAFLRSLILNEQLDRRKKAGILIAAFECL